jgi:hypothetical protein
MKIQSKMLLGLRKYNKVFSIIIKEKKKSGQPYSFREVQKEASRIYRADFRQVNLSKIRVKDVKESLKKTEDGDLKAIDVPAYWFDAQSNFNNWYQVGEWANRFSNTYPNIPVMLITKTTQRNPLVVRGATGDYDGSIFQSWTEERREEIDNSGDSQDSGSWEIGNFFGTPAYQNKEQIYAVWFEEGVDLPKVAPKPIEIEERKLVIIDELEKEEKERREKETPKKKKGRPKKIDQEEKKPLPKIGKKKPIEKKKDIEKPTPLADKNRAKELLLEEFRLGLITKKEYREDRDKIDKMYQEGGAL